MGDIADADIALRRGDDFARLDAAAALNQLAVEAGFLEIPDPVRNELRLIDGHRDRIDHPAGLVFGPRPSRPPGRPTARDNRQR